MTERLSDHGLNIARQLVTDIGKLPGHTMHDASVCWHSLHDLVTEVERLRAQRVLVREWMDDEYRVTLSQSSKGPMLFLGAVASLLTDEEAEAWRGFLNE